MVKTVYLRYENEERTENRYQWEPQMLSHLTCGIYLTFTILIGRKRGDGIYAHYVGKLKLHKI